MEKEELKKLIKSKIHRLLSNGAILKFCPAEKYRRSIIKLDLITCELNSIQDSYGNERWEDQVYLSFEGHPVLSGEDAEEIRGYLLEKNKSAVEAYLNN